MRTARKVINLYNDKNIFSIKHVVSIDKEEDLNQFWDYLTTTQDSEHEYLHDFVSNFYNFALSYMQEDGYQFFEIILEENDKNFYFTLWNEKISILFKKYLKNTSIESIYKENRISVKLTKKKYDKIIKKVKKENKLREKNLINSVKNVEEKVYIEMFTFIHKDDLNDLVALNDDMQEIVYQLSFTGMSEHHFIKLRSTFSLFCFTLRYYPEISQMVATLNEFLNLLNMDKEKFIQLSKLELELIYGFINNIDRWFTTLFLKGGADLHFMDNSIKADCETIAQIISPCEDDLNYDLDDIFEF